MSKCVTFYEATHTERFDGWLSQRKSEMPHTLVTYNGETWSDWAAKLYQQFITMPEGELIVCMGLHYAAVQNDQEYHMVNHLVNGLFALGSQVCLLNLEYLSGDCPFTEEQITYWVELTYSELIPLNAFAHVITEDPS